MAEIYVYGASATDFDNMGLVGALLPTSCIHEEEANGMSEVTIEHPYDEWGKWAAFENECILSVPVPVRTCPEITLGRIVTSVESWTVKGTATKAQRGVFTKKAGGRRKGSVKAGTSVTVVAKPADSDRYKIKAAKITGWIASAALDYDETEVIADNPGAIETVASPWSVREQYFRIYKVTRTLDGVTVNARHITYDLLGNVTTFSEAGSVTAQAALDGVIDGCYVDAGEFEAYTDSADARTGVHYERVNPIYALLDENEGVCERYGLELVRDNFEMYFLTKAGMNRGVSIEYGKNLTGLEATEDMDGLVTEIIPVGKKKNGDPLLLSGDGPITAIGSSSGTGTVAPVVDFLELGRVVSEHYADYAIPHIEVLECEDCEIGQNGVNKATALGRMREQARAVFEDGERDVLAMKLSVDFVNLAKCAGYEDYAELEKCFLYDTVTVRNTPKGFSAEARITRGVWDVLREQWNELELETTNYTSHGDWQGYLRRALEELREKAKMQYQVYIDWSNGTVMDSDNPATTASARVMKDGNDVTDDIAASCFNWERKTKQQTALQQAADAAWNAARAGTKSVAFTTSDIDGSAVIKCAVTISVMGTDYLYAHSDTAIFKRDGKDGTRIEYIFRRAQNGAAPGLDTSANQTPDYVPEGWTDDPLGISFEYPYEWFSMRFKNEGTWGEFTAPALWAKYGKDGDSVEYVYRRSAAFEAPALVTSAVQTDGYAPDGWTDEPAGISGDYPYEWVSMRTKTDEVWSAFSAPSLWSHYGTDGDDGSDGINGSFVEYVYSRSQSGTAPALDASAVQTDGFVPDGWTDEPTGVNIDNPYEWVAVRTKRLDVWSQFSAPALWAKYGADGKDIEYIYRRSITLAVPALVTSAVQTDDYTPDGWTDEPTGVNETYLYEWQSRRERVNEAWGEFSAPVLWAKYGVDGTDGTLYEHIYAVSASSQAPALDTTAVQQDGYVPSGWHDEPQTIGIANQYGWIAKRVKTAGVWGSFSAPALWSKYGLDGADVEYVYRRTVIDSAPALDTSAVQTDDYVPSGWTDDPLGVNETYLYEWQSQRRKTLGQWSAFSAPIIWAHYGADGTDGNMNEFVYRVTACESEPPITTTADGASVDCSAVPLQQDGLIPDGWTDEPTGASASLPYEWMAKRVKQNGEWGAFSTPAIWARYGVDGKSVEYVFRRSLSDSAPSLDVSAVQTDGYVPSGWTADPTGVNASYPYEWVSKRTKAAGSWSAFSTPALWAKYGRDGQDGQDGAAGPQGPQGAQGPQGLPGANGTKVYYGSGYPYISGNDGDLYYDMSGSNVNAIYRYNYGYGWSQVKYDATTLVVGNIVTASLVAGVITADMINALNITAKSISNGYADLALDSNLGLVAGADLSPSLGNQYKLGYDGGGRWKRLFTNNSVDVGSDRRLKKDIKPLETVELLRKLLPVKFRLKADDAKLRYGFIAQDVRDAITETDFAEADFYNGSNPDELSLRYDELIAPLVEGWQNHESRISALENENAALRTRIYEIEKRVLGSGDDGK